MFVTPLYESQLLLLNINDDNAKRHSSLLKKFLFCLRLSLSCFIIFYLLTIIDFTHLVAALSRLKPGYLLFPFLLLIALNLVSAIRWSLLLLNLGIRQSIRHSWRYYMISHFFSIILPGVLGGDIVRLGFGIKAHPSSKATLTISILFERACGMMVLMLMAAVAATMAPMLLEGESVIAAVIPWMGMTALFAFLLFFVVLKNLPPKWLDDGSGSNRWKQMIVLIFKQFRDLQTSILVLILLLSLSAHFLDILGSYLLSLSLNLGLPFTVFLLVMPIVYVVTSLPISLGGIGVREGVLTFFLVKVGVAPTDAVLLAFVIYLNRIFVGLIGGALQLRNRN